LSKSFEDIFDKFVGQTGGQRLPEEPKSGRKRADYLYRKSESLPIDILLEMKSLEDEGYQKYVQDTQQMIANWLRLGRIVVMGTAAVKYHRVAEPLRKEWDELIFPYIQNLIRTANRQLKQTKADLNLPDAKCIILLANEGNLAHFPTDLIQVASRILDPKRKQYLTTDALEYLSAPSVGLRARGIIREGSAWWIGVQRNPTDVVLGNFRETLRNLYGPFLAEHRGLPYRETRVKEPMDIHRDRFDRPDETELTRVQSIRHLPPLVRNPSAEKV